MADEWKAGDLAACVETPLGCLCGKCAAAAKSTVRRGGLYIVADVELRRPFFFMGPQVYLRIQGQGALLYHHALFRKVPPIENDVDRRDEAPVRPPENTPA